ncbi:DUF1499 domain-containing protein [Aliiroseovarius salicola]|uniref:DUF1499 domain-containing protein n=1 Tax=Aliiroseovarius salicola TaxID=3009082 RepID=UPI0038CBFB08
MNNFFWGLIGLLAMIAILASALAIYARSKPLPTVQLRAQPGPEARGFHHMKGGAKCVLPLGQLPEDGHEMLLQIIRRTERTKEVFDTPQGHSFVTRSKLFGFPDITRIWIADGHLHIYSSLVIGRSDLGVNARRLEGWITQLFQQSRSEIGAEASPACVTPDRDIQTHVA